MKSKISIIIVLFTLLISNSCLKVNPEIGKSLVPKDQKFELHHIDSIYLTNVQNKVPEGLSEFSNTRLAFGSINDKDFGLTEKITAFSIVPFRTNIDFGKNRIFKSFTLKAVFDNASTLKDEDRFILQNINAYSLNTALNTSTSTPDIDYDKDILINSSSDIYNGSDSLVVHFNKEFGERYLQMTNDDYKDIDTYTKKYPGVVLSTNTAKEVGGRINMFKLPIDLVNRNVLGTYAELKFSAEYPNIGRRDTTELFYLGPIKKHNTDGLLTSNFNELVQLAYNYSVPQEIRSREVEESIYFEGENGLKPVIMARDIKNALENIKKKTSSNIIFSKASLIMPYCLEKNKDGYNYFPYILSPTLKEVRKGKNGERDTIRYVSIPDNRISSINKGMLNKSLEEYRADITLLLQDLLQLNNDEDIDNFDLWLLPMIEETLTSRESLTEEEDNRRRELEAAQYYYSMMNGYGGGYGYGYGGYGSYGGYGGAYGYPYNYIGFPSMRQSNNQTKVIQLDQNRFYKLILNGTNFPDKHKRPRIELTFATYSLDNK